jgi:hypothetical protein
MTHSSNPSSGTSSPQEIAPVVYQLPSNQTGKDWVELHLEWFKQDLHLKNLWAEGWMVVRKQPGMMNSLLAEDHVRMYPEFKTAVDMLYPHGFFGPGGPGHGATLKDCQGLYSKDVPAPTTYPTPPQQSGPAFNGQQPAVVVSMTTVQHSTQLQERRNVEAPSASSRRLRPGFNGQQPVAIMPTTPNVAPVATMPTAQNAAPPDPMLLTFQDTAPVAPMPTLQNAAQSDPMPTLQEATPVDPMLLTFQDMAPMDLMLMSPNAMQSWDMF